MNKLMDDANDAQEAFTLDELEEYARKWREENPELVKKIEESNMDPYQNAHSEES